MNLNSIKDKIKESKLISSIIRNPFFIGVSFVVVAISLVNFSEGRSTECPAILTYDEISEAINLHYCKIDNETYQLEALDRSGIIQAKQVQYTVNGAISVLPWSDSKIIVNSLPDYVLLNLIFSDACFKNNSTDVSFPIDLSSVSECATVNAKEKLDSVEEISNGSEDIEELEEGLDDDSIIELEADQVSDMEGAKISADKRKLTQERLQLSEKENALTKARPFNGATDTAIKKEKPVIEIIKANTPNQALQKVAQHPTNVDVNKADNRILEKEVYSPISKIEANEYVVIENELVLDENTIAEYSTEDYTAPIESSTSVGTSSSAVTKSSVNVSLFNTKTIGIKKSCINNSSRVKSKTDLFTMSIKPNMTITLYDIYCYAAVNSEMTITLSQLGEIINSFSVSLNKGENQIGLTSLGLLEADVAYLIEYTTKNKDDVYLFSECKNMSMDSNEIIIRYMDNQNAFYGLTYEIEIE